MATLEEIRKKLQNMENRQSGGNNRAEGGSLTYHFWNMPLQETAVLRFLPDANTDNTFFWKERKLINLDFPGIAGEDDRKTVVVKVPCMEMYGDTCPILKEIRPWWNDKSLEDMARKYWQKRSYFFQGFVNTNPIEDDQTPDNPIRRFIIGPQIFNIIKGALLDPDMENIPTDYINGTDFRITRTQKGQYNDYSTSSWARRETSLTEDQLEAIEKFGLYDLNDWMPPKPNAEALNAISEMFEASVNGELYDPEKWASYFRPYGLQWDGDSSSSAPSASSSTSTKTEAEVVSPAKEEKSPVEEAPEAAVTEEPKKNVNDILAKIKARAGQE